MRVVNPPARKALVNFGLAFLLRAGFYDALRRVEPRWLTVLNYHRVAPLLSNDTDAYIPNISATPEMFEKQMDYVREKYNVVSCSQVSAWVRGEGGLPSRAALITFDDGYQDNLEFAAPILQRRNIPAVIFLASDYMGRDEPFYWDLAAYCFYHTELKSADLPLLGRVEWTTDPLSRNRIMNRWVNGNKKLPDAEKKINMEALSSILKVDVPTGAFSGLYLNWDQVRTLLSMGMEMGSHTASHPIMTRVSLEQAEAELVRSGKKIEQEIGRPVTSFAYPNGQAGDFSPAFGGLLAKTGYEVAFTLLPGPTRYRTVKQSPYFIRRIFLGHSDTFPRFAAKLAGMEMLSYKLRHIS